MREVGNERSVIKVEPEGGETGVNLDKSYMIGQDDLDLLRTRGECNIVDRWYTYMYIHTVRVKSWVIK